MKLSLVVGSLALVGLSWVGCRASGLVQDTKRPYGAPPAPVGPGPLVRGTAIEARTGKPLGGATVVGPGDVETKTDAEGRFSLRLAHNASGELVVRTDGGLEGRNRLLPRSGGELEVVIFLR